MSVYDSRVIANHLIGKAGEPGLDALQVMKLVYISHGFVLGLTQKPLLEDDVEAWRHGPVMRRIYKHLPGGYARLKGRLIEIADVDIDAEQKAIVDDVFDKYRNFSGLYLSSLTHREGSPWKKTWDTYGKNAVIPQDLIQAHYTEIVRLAREAKDQAKSYAPTAL